MVQRFPPGLTRHFLVPYETIPYFVVILGNKHIKMRNFKTNLFLFVLFLYYVHVFTDLMYDSALILHSLLKQLVVRT